MNILIFAGTGDGRMLVETLKEHRQFKLTVCVATEYGKEVLENESLSSARCLIKSGRLNEDEMAELMGEGFDYVIDATHPYAQIVSENIKKAASKTKIKYLRLLRDKTEFSGSDYVLLKDTAEVIKYLEKQEGNVLLAVGSKELGAYSKLQEQTGKLYARVLPLEEVVADCKKNGFTGKNLICMQGPFSTDLNVAMLKQYNCRFLVTKDTGKAGGADEKYLAAKAAGATLVVVGRSEERGMSFSEILDFLGAEQKEGCKTEKEAESLKTLCSHFPMFVDIENKNICVLGAGKIARRRITTLLQFACNLRIVAKEISDEVKALTAENPRVELFERTICDEDIDKVDILILATNNKEENSRVAVLAKQKGKIVNVADDKSLCDFYFPGMAISGDLVCGITAQGRNHKLSRKATSAVRQLFEEIGNWEEK